MQLQRKSKARLSHFHYVFLSSNERLVIFYRVCEHNPFKDYSKVMYFDRYLSRWTKLNYIFPNACHPRFDSLTLMSNINDGNYNHQSISNVVYLFNGNEKNGHKNIKINLLNILPLEWEQERIIWIGYYKNIHTNHKFNKLKACIWKNICHVSKLPKDIVWYLLHFLR